MKFCAEDFFFKQFFLGSGARERESCEKREKKTAWSGALTLTK
jgi:hypothetical protein